MTYFLTSITIPELQTSDMRQIQFTSHAALNGLFPERQSAYRQFHSTESAVLVLHNDIICAIDRGEITGLVLLDLSSAFDTVDHTSLLLILESGFSVTGHAVTGMVPLILDGPCTLLGPVRLPRYH